MRIAEVVGRLTLSRAHPSLRPGRYVVALPLTLAGLRGEPAGRGEDLVVFDELGAGRGALIGVSEGREGANPFNPDRVPIDAYCACLLDQINVEPK